MKFKLAELFTELTAKDGKLKATLNKSEKHLKAVSKQMDVVAESSKMMLVAGGAAFGYMIYQASKAQEVASKFTAVFKDQEMAANRFAESMAKGVGRSRTELKGFLAQLQDTFVPLGFARAEARKMSQQLTKLAIDLASFNNMADTEVIDALTSAMVGNHETVRRFGVIISAATLDQKLLSMGFKTSAKGATEQQKAMARLNMIIEGTADAQGDALRTADSFANQMKALKAAVDDTAVALGEVFLPAATKTVGVMKGMAEATRNMDPAAMKGLATAFSGLGISAGGLTGLSYFIKAMNSLKGGWAALAVMGTTSATVGLTVALGELGDKYVLNEDMLKRLNELREKEAQLADKLLQKILAKEKAEHDARRAERESRKEQAAKLIEIENEIASITREKGMTARQKAIIDEVKAYEGLEQKILDTLKGKEQEAALAMLKLHREKAAVKAAGEYDKKQQAILDKKKKIEAVEARKKAHQLAEKAGGVVEKILSGMVGVMQKGKERKVEKAGLTDLSGLWNQLQTSVGKQDDLAIQKKQEQHQKNIDKNIGKVVGFVKGLFEKPPPSPIGP